MEEAKVTERLTPRCHRHVEAFCLMHYQCKACHHHEIIWNSRDGVTPFGMQCPSCGGDEMMHVFWKSDVYAPDHKPHKGQRVWVSMTKENALKYARGNVERGQKNGLGPVTDELIEQVAENYYHNGEAPDLVVHGYTESV